MQTTLDVLETLKRRLSITSDYALAKLLKVPRQTVSNWRVGRNAPDDYTAVRIAELLGEAPIRIIAIVNAERTKRPHEAKHWRELARASMLATALITSGIFDAEAGAAKKHESVQSTDTVYIMRRRRTGGAGAVI